MKVPICGICLEQEILCSACQGKVESGQVTDSEVGVLRKINKISDRIKVLKEANVKRVVDTTETLLIISETGSADRLVGKGGIAAKRMSEEFGKNVRIVEETQDIREFVQSLLFPVPVLSMNTLFSDNGETLRVVVSRESRPPVSGQELGKITKIVFDKGVNLVIE